MMRPRIVFCYRYGVLGGVSTQILNRLPHLVDDFEVSVLFGRDHGMAQEFPAGVVQVVTDDEDRAEALRCLDPAVVVVIDTPEFVEAWAEAGRPGRLVLEVHTTTRNLEYLNNPAAMGGLAHVVTVSAYMEKVLREHGLGTSTPISVVPNCLDGRWLEKPAAHKKIGITPVGWVGKLDGHKRWRAAADIMDRLCSELSDPAITPLFVGGYTAPPRELEDFTTRLGSSVSLARGWWWPRVEYALMPALYSMIGSNGGLVLSTTTNESFGMSVAEAILQGCPVVAPAVGALPELLPAQAMYSPGDQEGAIEKAGRAVTDPTFRASLLETAEHIADITDPARAMEKYRSVLRALV